MVSGNRAAVLALTPGPWGTTLACTNEKPCTTPKANLLLLSVQKKTGPTSIEAMEWDWYDTTSKSDSGYNHLVIILDYCARCKPLLQLDKSLEIRYESGEL